MRKLLLSFATLSLVACGGAPATQEAQEATSLVESVSVAAPGANTDLTIIHFNPYANIPPPAPMPALFGILNPMGPSTGSPPAESPLVSPVQADGQLCNTLFNDCNQVTSGEVTSFFNYTSSPGCGMASGFAIGGTTPNPQQPLNAAPGVGDMFCTSAVNGSLLAVEVESQAATAGAGFYLTNPYPQETWAFVQASLGFVSGLNEDDSSTWPNSAYGYTAISLVVYDVTPGLPYNRMTVQVQQNTLNISDLECSFCGYSAKLGQVPPAGANYPVSFPEDPLQGGWVAEAQHTYEVWILAEVDTSSQSQSATEWGFAWVDVPHVSYAFHTGPNNIQCQGNTKAPAVNQTPGFVGDSTYPPGFGWQPCCGSIAYSTDKDYNTPLSCELVQSTNPCLATNSCPTPD